MYIPLWLIVIGIIIAIWIYNSRKKAGFTERPDSVESIENSVRFLKEARIFNLEHFDSTHFIDKQNAFDAMEINYLRLKQRFSHIPEKVLEIARDWFKYVEALGDLKFARVMLDVDMSDEAFDNMDERSKEPSIIKDEVEKKFKSLLGEDWQKIPPDYFERMETTKKPDKETEAKLGIADEWKYYYAGSANLFRLEEKRQKQKKELETEKQKKANTKEK